MMFKLIFLTAFVVAVSSGHRNHYGNFIEYDDVPAHIVENLRPYAYKDNGLRYGQVITPEAIYTPYEHVPLPVATEVRHEALATVGIAAPVPTYTGSLMKSFAFSIIKKIPALIVGFLSAIGVCMFTPLCSNLTSFNLWTGLPSGFLSFMTPERVRFATDFVKQSIRKYNGL